MRCLIDVRLPAAPKALSALSYPTASVANASVTGSVRQNRGGCLARLSTSGRPAPPRPAAGQTPTLSALVEQRGACRLGLRARRPRSKFGPRPLRATLGTSSDCRRGITTQRLVTTTPMASQRDGPPLRAECYSSFPRRPHQGHGVTS